MGDARFFARSSPHALAAIAATAHGTAPPIERIFSGVAPLQSAGPDQVSFLDNRRYAAALEHTAAGAVIVHPDMLPRVPPGTIPIVTTAAYEGWARVAALFHPVPPPCPGIHVSAVVAGIRTNRRLRRSRTLCRHRGGRGDRRRLPHRSVRVDRQGRDRRRGLPDRRACQPKPRAAGGARLYLPGRPDRPGRLQLRRHRDRVPEHSPAWARDRRGRCGGWRQYHDRPGIDARHRHRRGVASR